MKMAFILTVKFLIHFCVLEEKPQEMKTISNLSFCFSVKQKNPLHIIRNQNPIIVCNHS